MVFSFSDCPWCVAAKATLGGCEGKGAAGACPSPPVSFTAPLPHRCAPIPTGITARRYSSQSTDTIHTGTDLAVYEIDEMGREGKVIRAALAETTGRTSMPNVFVGGRSIGGYTDGYVDEGQPVAVPRENTPRGQGDLGREEWVWPGSPGLEALHASGRLREILPSAPL